jgi:hypothetical protein
MGGVCCRTILTISEVVDLPVSASEMANVHQDFEGAPNFIPHLVAIDRLRGNRFFEMGSHFRKVRRFMNRTIVVYVTVTKINHNPYSVTMSVNLQEWRWDTRNAVETFTFEVQPIDNDRDSCRIIWRGAFISGSIIGSITSAIYGPCWKRMLHVQFASEMQCYEDEAMKRRGTRDIR